MELFKLSSHVLELMKYRSLYARNASSTLQKTQKKSDGSHKWGHVHATIERPAQVATVNKKLSSVDCIASFLQNTLQTTKWQTDKKSKVNYVSNL